jgi:hypothetical protein
MNSKENKFNADDILTQINNEKQGETLPKEDLKPLKLFKTYELNDEGLRLYGIYKKQQSWTIFKWSFLGTAFGCISAFIIDVTFKKMNFNKKDYLKTIFLFGSIGLCTYYGIEISTYNFRLKQKELSQNYGREVDDSSYSDLE